MWLVLAIIAGVVAVIEPGGLTQLFGGLSMLPPFILLSLLAGYAMGVIPAAVTGVVCHLAARRAGRVVWLVVAALAGFAVTVGVALVATLTLTQAIYSGAIGTVAAVFCAWLVRRTPRA